jgi:signal transduction histidine kinase
VRALRIALLPLGIALGLAAEWAAYDSENVPLAIADFAVGALLIVCGAVAWERRPGSRVGALMSLAGFTWFLGTLFEPALFLHRGPLVHLHLSYPTGRLPTRLARVVVVVAYVDAAIEPLARNDALTLGLSGAVALAAFQVFRGTSGTARKAGGPALAAALAFAGVLAFAALGRLAGWNDDTILWVYDVVIASVAVGLLVDLLRGRWADAVVTGLVVDLGATSDAGTLRAKLAGALGDPSLVVGYRLPGTERFVDEAGRHIELPPPGSGRVITPIEDRGEQVAVLVHDEALLTDRTLLESVAAAARIAVANPRLQAEARARADELEASRRRIVEAGDGQRRRLEEELREGAERRLETVGALLAEARAATRTDGDAIAELEGDLARARDELREFAQGIHPSALDEGGLMPALAQLAGRLPLPVEIRGEVGRLPEPVETALFFVCSEALANVAKHASASHAAIRVKHEHDRVVVEVADDGIGAADPARGTGLRGLADRVEALGGHLRVASPAGGGTRLEVEIRAGAGETRVGPTRPGGSVSPPASASRARRGAS